MLRRGCAALRASLARSATTWHKPAMAADLPSPGGGRVTVTVLPGDGVGPEVIRCAQEAVAATGAAGRAWQPPAADAAAPPSGAPVDWESFHVSGAEGSRGYAKTMPREVMESISRNKVCLKGAERRAGGRAMRSPPPRRLLHHDGRRAVVAEPADPAGARPRAALCSQR